VDINNLESFCRYLLSCLRYAFIDVVRDQRKWDGTNHDPLGRATSESGVIDVALAQAQDEGSLDPAKTVLWIEFHEKIASLPDDERFVFEPHYYLGMSRRMISVRLGISEHEVRRLLLLAKQHLGDVFPET